MSRNKTPPSYRTSPLLRGVILTRKLSQSKKIYYHSQKVLSLYWFSRQIFDFRPFVFASSFFIAEYTSSSTIILPISRNQNSILSSTVFSTEHPNMYENTRNLSSYSTMLEKPDSFLRMVLNSSLVR